MAQLLGLSVKVRVFGKELQLLVSFLLQLDRLDLAVGLLVDGEAFEFDLNLAQNRPEGLPLALSFFKCCVHLGEPLVEGFGAGHFGQHVQEAGLATTHKTLHLALLDDLELRLAVQVEPSGLKQIKEFLFADMLPIQVVVFPVGRGVVRFPQGEFG